MDPRACDGWTTVCPLWLLGVPSRVSETRTVEFLHLELLSVDAVQATHVEHHHVFAARPLTVGVRLDAARLAEGMVDRALAELIVRHLILAREKLEVRHRDGGEQSADLTAARAIAGDDFPNISLCLVANISALATAGVGLFHCSLLFTDCWLPPKFVAIRPAVICHCEMPSLEPRPTA